VRHHLALAALAACLLICATTTADAKLSPYYSRADVDRLIDQLRRELLSKTPSNPPAPPAAPQGYSKAEVDDLLAKLRAEIQKDAVTKSDLAQATQPFVTSQQLDNAIDQATKMAESREKALVTSQQLDNAIDQATKMAESREKALDNKNPTVPFWISPLVALAALLISIISPFWNRRNTVQDTAGARAREYIHEGWREHVCDYTSAMALLKKGDRIEDPMQLNKIVKIGNFFDRLASEVVHESADAAIIAESALKRHAINFKVALESRLEPTIISNLTEWNNLRQWGERA
jgi:hypothetical protein